ncbi:LLM class flavin-dependent oxidoreductase [Peribacillus muralis]|uniref:LLM class flavin-dependent oxidoreductase n=1 Tax=Peribacillus muralis TaxID=264697 RepID=UPI00070C6287|nr:LLM class flavin-dependent oxidoreductase [Peribacillus muralis]MCK1993338.1 LLM class flavin-dependent oxidoreductase [Peribacillus muralis]MCK2014374.1 LLM class flavin-dependent oxidoreductase [Peribacillus muralis]
MKLSILDQSPIASGQTAQEALQASLQLAQAADMLGYHRIWFTEHHDLAGLACSVPEVLISYVGAQTKNIRIGSGAVLLPHYKPYRVAETYNMLAALFPGRIDLGIGRAPGGSAEATMALNDDFLQNVYKMPERIKELLSFLRDDFPKDHLFSKISAAPIPSIQPEPWILGTSGKSAMLAAENGTAYAFGEFMSENDGVESLQKYREQFQMKGELKAPKTIVTVAVICAETEEYAKEIALSNTLWHIQSGYGEKKKVPSMEEVRTHMWNEKEKELLGMNHKKMIIGSPSQVKQRLLEIQENYQADEIMIMTITHKLMDKLNSYRLIAKELLDG